MTWNYRKLRGNMEQIDWKALSDVAAERVKHTEQQLLNAFPDIKYIS